MKNKFRIFSIILLVGLVSLACGMFNGSNTPLEPTQVRPVTVAQPQAPIQIPDILTNEEAVLVNLYNLVNPSVVNIIVYSRSGSTVIPSGQGSGFVYDSAGNIVTNAHVIHGAERVEVIFSDGSTHKAEVVGEDLHADLAVIKVTAPPEGTTFLPLADMNTVAVGQTVIAIGNPFGLGGTMTRGIISALGRTIPALTTFSIPQAIQTDAPINPGNSGGPLLNLKGEVIGVNAQIETGGTSRTNSGIGFAIPVSIVKVVVPDLIDFGKHPWTWLGVRGGSVTAALAEAMNLPSASGAYVSEVIANGPASQAKLRGSSGRKTIDSILVETGGDVIIAIDNNPVRSFEDILIYLSLNTSPGDQVVLLILRDGKEIEIKVTLSERPSESTTNQSPE